VDDVATLKTLLLEKERILQSHHFPHKSILLKDSLEFKQFYYGLPPSDPINFKLDHDDDNNSSNRRTCQLSWNRL
jgi:hypothetical protein